MYKISLKLFIFLFLMIHNTLYACQPFLNNPYLIEFDKYLFVMIEGDEEYITYTDQIYEVSGMYKKDGNYNGPEWTVDWYITKPFADFYIDDNGKYLIQVNKNTYPKQIALAFYDQGKLIKEYKVSDLIKDVDAIWDDLHECFPGEWMEKILLDSNKAIIETKNNEHYVFNIKTGEILESKYH